MRSALGPLVFAALLSLFMGGCASGPSALNSQTSADVWLLIGQSNMSGRGDLGELSPSEKAPDPRIQVLGNDGVLATALEPLDSPEGQIDAVSRDDLTGVGPGLHFARARVLKNPGRRVVLVPCAKGGSGISDWSPSTSRTTLFGSCLARALEARRGANLAGVLWYQGETDARSVTEARAWSAAFCDLIAGLRKALGVSTLPVLVVSLADPPMIGPYASRYPAWSEVQAAQSRLDMAGVLVISASGLPKTPDDLHLSTPGQRVLGERLAEAAERVPR